MKGIATQLIVSSVALVLMTGAVGFHWWKLDATGGRAPGSDWQVLSGPGENNGGMMHVSTGGTMPVAVDGEPVSAAAQQDVESVTVQALQEVVSVLRAMKTENENLRAQLRDIYGEMNGMQIQIDGYDNKFIPLKLDPTYEGVIDSGNPLLPPKRW